MLVYSVALPLLVLFASTSVFRSCFFTSSLTSLFNTFLLLSAAISLFHSSLCYSIQLLFLFLFCLLVPSAFRSCFFTSSLTYLSTISSYYSLQSLPLILSRYLILPLILLLLYSAAVILPLFVLAFTNALTLALLPFHFLTHCATMSSYSQPPPSHLFHLFLDYSLEPLFRSVHCMIPSTFLRFCFWTWLPLHYHVFLYFHFCFFLLLCCHLIFYLLLLLYSAAIPLLVPCYIALSLLPSLYIHYYSYVFLLLCRHLFYF